MPSNYSQHKNSWWVDGIASNLILWYMHHLSIWMWMALRTRVLDACIIGLFWYMHRMFIWVWMALRIRVVYTYIVCLYTYIVCLSGYECACMFESEIHTSYVYLDANIGITYRVHDTYIIYLSVCEWPYVLESVIHDTSCFHLDTSGLKYFSPWYIHHMSIWMWMALHTRVRDTYIKCLSGCEWP